MGGGHFSLMLDRGPPQGLTWTQKVWLGEPLGGRLIDPAGIRNILTGEKLRREK